MGDAPILRDTARGASPAMGRVPSTSAPMVRPPRLAEPFLFQWEGRRWTGLQGACASGAPKSHSYARGIIRFGVTARRPFHTLRRV
jgi:hypothetical protein